MEMIDKLNCPTYHMKRFFVQLGPQLTACTAHWHSHRMTNLSATGYTESHTPFQFMVQQDSVCVTVNAVPKRQMVILLHCF